jgi:hypothetical protein
VTAVTGAESAARRSAAIPAAATAAAAASAAAAGPAFGASELTLCVATLRTGACLPALSGDLALLVFAHCSEAAPGAAGSVALVAALVARHRFLH